MRKLPRLPLKKTEKLAEKQAYGETLGKLKAEYHFKETKKGWLKSLREHIGKAIDNINMLELGAVLGLTWFIHDRLMMETDLTKTIANIVVASVKEAKRIEEIIKPFEPYFRETSGVWRSILTAFLLGVKGEEIIGTTQEFLGELKLSPVQRERFGVYTWIISFVLAYIIVKHGGQIIGLGGEIFKSVIDFAKWLIASIV